jgi:hypothetical protein
VSFSIRTTIRAFVRPRHRLACSKDLWRRCRDELVRRSDGRHESGAFFLGEKLGSRRLVRKTIYYDDLDPKAYASGVCILTGKSFGELWRICREERLTVVADIHTHVGEAFQSEADRTNPMVGVPGHIALIAPDLGRSVDPGNLCVYEYLGRYRWIDHSNWSSSIFYVGFWA